MHGCFAAPAERLKRATWRVGRLIMIKQSASTTGAVLGASGAPVLALLAGSLAAAPSLFPQAGLAPGTGGLFADLAAWPAAAGMHHLTLGIGDRDRFATAACQRMQTITPPGRLASSNTPAARLSGKAALDRAFGRTDLPGPVLNEQLQVEQFITEVFGGALQSELKVLSDGGWQVAKSLPLS